MLNFGKIQEILGKDGDSLIGFKNPKVSKDSLHLPGSDFIDRIFQQSDRNPQVLRNLQSMFDHGRLGGARALLDSVREDDRRRAHRSG